MFSRSGPEAVLVDQRPMIWIDVKKTARLSITMRERTFSRNIDVDEMDSV